MAHALDLTLRSYGARPLCHSHAFHQIVLPVAGSLEMEVDGRGGRVEGCQAALIAAGQPHRCEAAGDNRFLVLDWITKEADRDEALSRLSDLAECRPFLAYDWGLQHLVNFLDAELRERTPSAGERSWGGLLLSALAARASAGRPAHPRQIGRAIAYIRTHHRRPLTVEEIAYAACCSVSHLHALFQRYLGTSPMDNVAETRLDEAMSRLSAGHDSISAIALDTGHADQSVLTRSMKRRRGVTPAAYRRRARPVIGRA
jgi:AraC-like DNA-binding protein